MSSHSVFRKLLFIGTLSLLLSAALIIIGAHSAWASGYAYSQILTCNDVGSICSGTSTPGSRDSQDFDGSGSAEASASDSRWGGTAESSISVSSGGDTVSINGSASAMGQQAGSRVKSTGSGRGVEAIGVGSNPSPGTALRIRFSGNSSGTNGWAGSGTLEISSYDRYGRLTLLIRHSVDSSHPSPNIDRLVTFNAYPGQVIWVVGQTSAQVFNASAESSVSMNASVTLVRPCPTITSFTADKTEFKPASGETVKFSHQINGQYDSAEISVTNKNGTKHVVDSTWDGKLGGVIAKPGDYPVTLTVKKAGCGDVTKTLSVTVKQECPTIESFTANKAGFAPESGETVRFYHKIIGQYDSLSIIMVSSKRVYTLPNPWNGRLGGRLPDPGTYTAVLVVEKEGCDPVTKSLPVTVKRNEEDCKLSVTIGSSANVASGGLTHSQPLFSGKGTGLATSMSLYYNSVDPYEGSLGRGWSHDFSISVTENADGSVLIREPNGVRRLYTPSGGAYVPPTVDYSTLVKNNSTFALTRKDGIRYNFDATGNIASIVDRNGNAMTFAYAGGNLTSIADPAGRTTTLAYVGDKLASITDPAGHAWLLTVSGDTLTGVTQPDGGTWAYTYDADGFMLTKTDPMGYTTTYAYDAEHRMVSATDPEGKTRSISYPATDDSGATKTTTFTEKDGGAWSYAYDTEVGKLTRKTDPDGNATSYTYDSSGNLLTKTEPDGGTTSYTYDAQGNMASTTDVLGKATTYTYNGFGQVTSVTASDGTTTSYEYDAFGNLISVADPAGATTRYEYDSKGNVVKTTNANGQSTVFGYDRQINLISVTDPTGATTRLAYDSAGNITSVTDPSGATTRFEYDSLGRLIKVTDPLGNITGYSYDAAGNKTSVTDANGNVTRYEYNYKGQLIKTTDALGHVTTYTYGSTGCGSCGGGVDKLTSLTDASGHSTSFEYDRLGRVIKETDPLGNFSTYAYDADGKLIAETDANGNTISYGYDSLGRLLLKSYPDGSTEAFTYDAKGNLLTAGNKYIAYSFAYDASSRVTEVTDSRGLTVQYQYDNLGNRTSMTTPEGRAVSYGYDVANQLRSIISGNDRFSFGYDTLGRRISLAYPNGVTTSYGYDKDSRLTGIATRNNRGEVLDSYTYTHDKVGNRLSKAEPDTKNTYNYDAVYKLLQSMPTKLHGKDKEQEHKAENYAYDPVGNRLTGPKPKDAAFYNQGNQLTNDRKHQYEYDKNGNLIRKTETDDDGITKVWTYGYDYENRLIKVEIQKGGKIKVVNFTYDPFGRRLSKAVHREEIEDRDDDKDEEETECPRTTYYVYDNEDIILEYNHKGKVTARYLHGPGIDEPLAVEKKHGRYYYHADGLGSVMSLSDAKGKIAQRYDYNSFGNLKHNGNKVKQPYAYTGREWDKETGLYYYRARYYDPKIGRFIQKDPIGFAGGDVNLFSYVGQNPGNWVDPWGLEVIVDLGRTYDGRRAYQRIRDDNSSEIFYDPPVGNEQQNNDSNKCHLIPGQFATASVWGLFQAALTGGRTLMQDVVSPIGNMMRYRTPVIIDPNIPMPKPNSPNNLEARAPYKR